MIFVVSNLTRHKHSWYGESHPIHLYFFNIFAAGEGELKQQTDSALFNLPMILQNEHWLIFLKEVMDNQNKSEQMFLYVWVCIYL